MIFKNRYLPHLASILLLGVVCWLCIYVLLMPSLNLSPSDNGHLPIISLRWNGSTLQPTYDNGTVQTETASVHLNLPNLDASVLKPTEEFLSERLMPESLEKLLPLGHRLYGLLEYNGNYWVITGKQISAPYLVAVGSFHQREKPEDTPVKYRDFYKQKLAYMHSGGASMSSAY